MSKIIDIYAREILDSRGNPTIAVKVTTELGAQGVSMVPSGASTGTREACELRDAAFPEFKDNWFGGKGVMKAVTNTNEIIAPELIGLEVSEQRLIDMTMIKLDGTKNKTNLGANAILGVSLAVARAAAEEAGLPLYRYIGGTNARTLPVPMLNVMNGGAHSSNTVDMQEFMIMPVGAKTFREALQMANKVFHNLGKLLKKEHGTTVGDEGGYAPNLKSHEEVLDYMVQAIKAAGLVPATSGEKAVAIAMDPAASEFYDEKAKKYVFKKLKQAIDEKRNGFDHLQDVKLEYTTEELVDYYEKLVNTYPIISIEDGLAESDWDGFKLMNQRLGDRLQIVGDDLTVTNQEILREAIKKDVMNSILIKLNQIGSLSETLDTMELAHKAGFTCVVSHRSGETEDTTIADLAVALNTGQIKTGSLSRTDRIAKYNRLLEIEDELGETSKFDGEKTYFNLKRHV
ncbi:phosphopyruvate hydratase [Mycoplasma zalophidermidis]|uniref:Enolase n=1 Tax=Mycoplasma zalophidermidis TaxID=398174 RepID=A0ABS6DS38_9MOLU|nr:phosphopyruvate hydratase [Mycoplasma zalophidermidis]MBU4689903.1 phosphopyruvate hydratase [Mycoplasma zalophidermidis]MBU4693806.1 phosphopyruvate hydratase [Mycoplasma zalophidermidis]MCR8966812.1 phosphopyruvate hydratase [Mycoplasma zalophidermidis]